MLNNIEQQASQNPIKNMMLPNSDLSTAYSDHGQILP